uniref:MFS-type transporter C6orf192 n=1 Tax=Aceria tosichella TaxID=561515 RepID=A0A6G1S8P3_9ACAR
MPDAPTTSFERSTLIRHTCSIDQIQASFNESIKNHRKNYTTRQLLVIFTYIYGNFFLAACVSLQAPFFPKEAENKGASATEYGLVFGVYELAIIFMSPIVGKLVGQSSPKLWIQFGLLMTGVMTVIFGFLDRAPNGKCFIILAFLVRILEGVGAASFTTPSYTATAEEFPNDQATILSLLETSFGIGLIVGPTLGGWLYEIGDYTLPFFALGSFLVFGAMLNFIASYGQETRIHDSKQPQAGYLKILLSPGIVLDALCVVTSLNFIGYNAATLETHLRMFKLSVMTVGCIFVITGAIYAFTTPIWGRMCKSVDTRVMSLVGCILCILGFIIIGPLPIIGSEPSLKLIIVALVLIGLGTGIKLVAALVGSFKYAIEELGMPDNKSTFGVCSSIYHTSTSVGAFLGPSIGGLLLDQVGYMNGTYFLFTFELILILGLVAFMVDRQINGSIGSRRYAGLMEDQEGIADGQVVVG